MNSGKSWVLDVDPSVYKSLKRFPRKDAERIFFVIDALPRDPFAGDIQKMGGEEYTWRRRVGAHRIFYELIPHDKTIHIFHVERRTSKTY